MALPLSLRLRYSYLGDELANFIVTVVHRHDFSQQSPLSSPCAHRPEVHHLPVPNMLDIIISACIKLPIHHVSAAHLGTVGIEKLAAAGLEHKLKQGCSCGVALAINHMQES